MEYEYFWNAPLPDFEIFSIFERASERSTMATSPPAADRSLVEASEVDSRLDSVVYDLSSKVQEAMESMLSKISEIDQHSVGVMEEIERSKTAAIERKKALEEEKERLEKAAYTVLDLFNRRDTN